MIKTYKGTYKPTNPKKYAGDASNIIYRSMWERHVMKWCDSNNSVIQWASEEVVVPYLCETDKAIHRYFIDFVIKFDNGKTILVEVKPFNQTQKPEITRGKSRKTILSEGLTYIKNKSKWKAASHYAEDRGWHFEIWTEKELTSMGILPKSTQRVQTKKIIKRYPPFRKKKKK